MKWEENVRKVVPYVAGEQPKKTDIIKLNTNECPYPPAPGVAKAASEMNCDNLRLYSDPNNTMLVEAIAAYYKVKPEQIFTGVGSDDVLAMSFLTFFHSDKPILFPDVTYSFYDVWAELFQIPYRQCPLDSDWQIKAEDYMQPNGGVIFPNPNAPTGLLADFELIEAILKKNQDVVVIVDEAYIDFGGNSAIPLLEKYDNLLVVQTFSKSRSMAGARIGFAVGNEKLIQYLNNVKFSFNSYTINMPAQLLGTEAVRDSSYFQETVHKIIRTREWVKAELHKMGFSFPDSKANFLFVTHEKIPAQELFVALREADIYVRYWKKPRIDNYLRITIGTDQEMKQLLEFLKQYLKLDSGNNINNL